MSHLCTIIVTMSRNLGPTRSAGRTSLHPAARTETLGPSQRLRNQHWHKGIHVSSAVAPPDIRETRTRTRPSTWRILAIAAACVYGAATVACSHTIAGKPRAQAAHCGETDTSLLTLARTSPDQPHIAVPQPHGWTVSENPTIHPHGSAMVMLSNPALKTAGHIPNVLLTVDVSTAPTAEPDPEQWAINTEIADIDAAGGASATITQQTPGTVCDHPSVTVHYVIENWESTAFIVVSASSYRQVWLARLNMLTRDPRNPTWIEDTQTMVDGFVMNEPQVH